MCHTSYKFMFIAAVERATIIFNSYPIIQRIGSCLSHWLTSHVAHVNESHYYESNPLGLPSTTSWGINTTFRLLHSGCLWEADSKVTRWSHGRVHGKSMGLLLTNWYQVRAAASRPVLCRSCGHDCLPMVTLTGNWLYFFQDQKYFPPQFVWENDSYMINIATPEWQKVFWMCHNILEVIRKLLISFLLAVHAQGVDPYSPCKFTSRSGYCDPSSTPIAWQKACWSIFIIMGYKLPLWRMVTIFCHICNSPSYLEFQYHIRVWYSVSVLPYIIWHPI